MVIKWTWMMMFSKKLYPTPEEAFHQWLPSSEVWSLKKSLSSQVNTPHLNNGCISTSMNLSQEKTASTGPPLDQDTMTKLQFLVKIFKINFRKLTSSWLELVPLDVNSSKPLLSWVSVAQPMERSLSLIMTTLRSPTSTDNSCSERITSATPNLNVPAQLLRA